MKDRRDNDALRSFYEETLMKIVFLDVASMGDDISMAPFAVLGEFRPYAATAPGEVAARVEDADIIVTNKVRLTRENLAGAGELRLICVAATGFDNIDIAYARSRGIGVCNVVGYSTESVTQVTFSIALALLTHMPAYTGFVVSGAYEKSNMCNLITPAFHELAGKTWGIVGYGHIGARVGAVASVFGCHVMACSRSPKPGVDCRSLAELLRESDIVSLHVPLSEETRGLIGREELMTMKPGAVLINVARGAVVDEDAVADAVLDGRILYGCDVYSAEPLTAGHPITRLYGCHGACLTPHMAWGSVEARTRCVSVIAENIRAFLRGEVKNRVEL